MPTDNPADATVQDMVDSVLAHRSEVSNGPFINFGIADQTIGGFVDCATDTEISLLIRVQAPSWMDVNYLRVYTNHGELATEIVIPDTTEVVRFDDTVVLPLDGDAYFVVEAGHTSATTHPVNRERVFAITNPIWVDANCNHAFDAPGLPVEE